MLGGVSLISLQLASKPFGLDFSPVSLRDDCNISEMIGYLAGKLGSRSAAGAVRAVFDR